MTLEADEGIFDVSSSVANGTGTLLFCDSRRDIYTYLRCSF